VRVAALYDVHAMPTPLAAVLEAVDDEGADVVLFGGDLISGPLPQRTLSLARAAREATFVRGNCEREPSEWDRSRLGSDELRWLAGLPLTASLDGVLYCHATPQDDLPLTTAETPEADVASAFVGVEEGVVVIGHTHHQFDRRAGGLRVVNAGSAGMPYEDDVAAFWALVEEGEPAFRRTPFDVERAVAEVRASGWPGADEFVAENLLVAPSRREAIEYFEAQRG
jgi:predicted phosphodiesterase